MAKELGSEFDSNSPNWWARHNPVKEFVGEINDVYAAQKEEVVMNRGAAKQSTFLKDDFRPPTSWGHRSVFVLFDEKTTPHMLKAP